MLWVTLFGISMAFIESAVVVYLRAIYYPDGFSFPLVPITDSLIGVELLRELATIVLLISVAFIAGRYRWERFAYFIFSFGVWDIFYYVWLKVLLDWPSTILEWDILFLIPLPWIGPVVAPVSVSVLMILFGSLIIAAYHRGAAFEPAAVSKILVLLGTVIILYSFMRDTDATLRENIPKPYLYSLLVTGELLYIAAFVIPYKRIAGRIRS